jgi:hypothetical protein
MDLIDKGIKARAGHRHLHRYLQAASGAREQRPSRDSAGSPETHAFLMGLGSLIRAGGRAPGWVIEVVSGGEFLTGVLGVPLRMMGNPAALLARVPAAREGGSR